MTRRLPEPGVAPPSRPGVQAILDAVLAHAPLATVVLDGDGRVLHHNDAFDALASEVRPGAPRPTEEPGEAGARLDAIVPELAPELELLVSQVLLSGEVPAPIELRTGPPRARHHWQVNAFPIRRPDEDLFGVGLIFADVTREWLTSRRERESRDRLDLSLAAAGMGTWEWDLVTNRVAWSAGMSAMLGLETGDVDVAGQAVAERILEADLEKVGKGLSEAVHLRKDYEDEFRLRRDDGELRWVQCRGRVVLDSAGEPVKFIGVAVDVTERHAMEDMRLRLLDREHQARVAAEASRERLALLAEVSGSLASTLDPPEVYRTLAQLLVPRLADWCILDALDEDGTLHETAIAHIDPRKVDRVREMRERRRVAGGDGIWSVRRTMRTGRSERVEDVTDDDLVAAAVDDEHLALLRSLAPRSALVAPLVARGRVLGGITMVVRQPRTYDADDQALLENVASRAAVAIDTAMLFDSRTEVARALQQTLLPPALPEIPGVDLAARYRVAESGIEIGGDFYDVFETAAGWNVVVGDVCGKGPAAAAVTGLFRHTLRAVAPSLVASEGDHGPAAILAATNSAILDQIDDTRFATAVLVSLNPRRAGTEALIACGGHPRPVLVRADGTIERVGVTGTLLGVLPDPALEDVSLELGAGDALVLFTDGVTEARNGSLLFGEFRLLEVLEGAERLHSAIDIADRLVQAVDEFRDPEASTDDIAVVTIRVPSIHDV